MQNDRAHHPPHRRTAFLKIALSFIMLLLSGSFPSATIHGATDFLTDYDTKYEIRSDGSARVRKDITLTNQKSNVYPKQFSITIDTDDIRDLAARDPSGPIRPALSVFEGMSTITVPFAERVIGSGRSLSFVIEYTTDDVARRVGSIWEVTIPGIAKAEDVGDYTVSVKAPSMFGPMSYASPEPDFGMTWSKERIGEGGALIAYGSAQRFRMTISYYLENTERSSQTLTMALPPDTAYQKVEITNIDPKPLNVEVDPDGNWLASYELDPGENVTVTVEARVTTSVRHRADYVSKAPDMQSYTAPTRYWNSDDPEIRTLAAALGTPRAIYEYVRDTLSYDEERVKVKPVRKGASATLRDPLHSICSEYTDLTIALLRAAGIPARQIIGYAYSTNSVTRPLSLVTDVLHAWPEYYDVTKRQWIPIDPTWADTTGGIDYFNILDYNHVAFAINGLSDDYPYPAGSYRESGKQYRSVDISFEPAETVQPEKAVDITHEIEFPRTVIAGMNARGTVRIRNLSGIALEGAELLAMSSPESVDIRQSISSLPPYTSMDIPFTFRSASVFSWEKGTVTATLNGQAVTQDFAVRPAPLIAFAFISILAVLSLAAWLTIRFITRKKL